MSGRVQLHGGGGSGLRRGRPRRVPRRAVGRHSPALPAGFLTQLHTHTVLLLFFFCFFSMLKYLQNGYFRLFSIHKQVVAHKNPGYGSLMAPIFWAVTNRIVTFHLYVIDREKQSPHVTMTKIE